MSDDESGAHSTRRGFLSAGVGSLLTTTAAAADARATGRSEQTDDPGLERLREKWFLSFEDDVGFPPSDRPAGEAAGLDAWSWASVEPVFDGQSFMKRWYETLTAMTENYPEQSAVYHQTLKLDQVPLLGAQHQDTISTAVISAAADAGVLVNAMLSGDVRNRDTNEQTVSELGIDTIVTDRRVPTKASNHQKVSIFDSPDHAYAMVGSIDLYKGRWGERPHDPQNPDRPTYRSTHDLAVRLEGPVVRQLQKQHLARWNDPSRDDADGNLGQGQTAPTLDPDPIESDVRGDQQVQILQTYGQTDGGYTWSEHGEFTAWAAYLKAIQNAEDYVYIEDQFFIPEGRPLWYEQETTDSPRVQSSLFYQLGEALKRGVDILVVTAPKREGGYFEVMGDQRLMGIQYLDDIATMDGTGNFEIATLKRGRNIYVHSKLMLVDDEVTYIGSMNHGRRSLSTDGEIQLAIIDRHNDFTRELRTELWRVHLRLSPAEATQQLADPQQGVETLIQGMRDEQGLLHAFPRREPDVTPGDAFLINFVHDPYSGPPIGGGFEPLARTPPKNILGDGLFRDVRGTGQFTILDVQALFDHLDDPTVQDNAWAFNFSGTDPDEVTVVDVQALFDDLQNDVVEDPLNLD
jgi:phosphatidylserine/phosphatidylglycerophosphate/cardiolipin synthase-like enzyme